MAASLETRVNWLPALAVQLPEAVAGFLGSTAEQALGIMQGFTPVDTGALQASEHVEHPDPHTWDVLAGTDHAYVVHFGTYKMPARPFIVQTVDALRDAFLGGVAALIPDLLR